MPPSTIRKRDISESPHQVPALDSVTLAQAFESFTLAAGSLEHSYGKLQEEVRRMRGELEIKNQELERSLKENERIRGYLAEILEDLPCGILAVDGSFKPRLANPQMRTFLSEDPELECGLKGKALPESLQGVLKDVAGEPAGTERVWLIETANGRKMIGITCAIRPLRAGGKDEHVFILRDLTEHQRIEEAKEVARRMKTLAEMTALLAHEIRNPLASLELFAGLIREATKDQADVSQWIVHIQAGLRALSATVNNVLHWHSPAMPQLIPLDLVRLLSRTVDFLRPLALQRGMGIEFESKCNEALIPADAHLLQQVFFNLATNAFRAMQPGKRLKIRVGAVHQGGQRQARVEFEDEGVGISSQNLEKIFEAGFSTEKNGPGLGLAVCRKVTTQHGGQIRVAANKAGQGTTFSLDFPLLGVPS